MGWAMPRRTARLVFEDPYEGAEVIVTLNVPLGKVLDFEERFRTLPFTHESVREAMAELVIEWNLETLEGEPIPPTADGFLMIDDLVFIRKMITSWRYAMNSAVDVEVPFVER